MKSEKGVISEPNDDERAPYPQHRHDKHPGTGRSARATQLWSEVGAGDSKAEVELARLHLKGDGVTRNCEQARVLLRAAAKRGNAEALQQYRKLDLAVCR